MTLNRFLKPALLIIALLGSTACSVLPQKPPLTVYQLPLPAQTQETNAEGAKTRRGSSIRVLTPASGSLLNGDRILVSRSEYQISAYKGVRWQEQIPRMVRNHLAQALKVSGDWHAVITDGNTARTHYQLAGELHDFQVYEAENGRTVQISFDATLIDVNDYRVVAARPFIIKKAVAGDDFNHVIESFSKATHQLGVDVTTWLQLHTKNEPR